MTLRRAMLAMTATASALLLTDTAPLHAQASCDVIDTTPSASTATSTPPHAAPLDRRVTLHEPDISLSAVLDRLGAATGVRLSYSSDVLELDRRVCVELRDVPVGDLLAVLLAGSGLGPKVVSPDHVALVPVPASGSTGHTPTDSVQAIRLEPIHLQVDRNATTASARPTHGTVITGERLDAHPAATLASLLNGAVPGFWAWGADGSGPGVQVGSMRGAASFSGSLPKVYLDGVELANPRTLAGLSPETIDYVEVISGPQGAALYGPNANSGVVNIHTRHGSASAGRPQVRLRSELGLSTGSVATRLRGTQTVGVDIGSEQASARMDLSAGFADAGNGLMNGGMPRRLEADLAGRLVGEHSVVTLTARYLTDDSDDEAVAGEERNLSAFGVPEVSIRETTVGLMAALHPEGRWTHTLTAGIDAYTVERPDHSLVASRGSQLDVTAGERTTLRLSSAGQFDLGRGSRALLTLVADHSLVRERRAHDLPGSVGSAGKSAPEHTFAPSASASDDALAGSVGVTGRYDDRPTASAGLGAQAELAVGDRMSIHGGLRFDRFGPLFEAGSGVVQPHLAASWTTGLGDALPVELTFRTAYGRAIRWHEHPTAQNHERASTNVAVEPTFEQQSGIEAGVDVRWGRSLSLYLTRFDQTASSLSQRVDTPIEGVAGASNAPYAGNVGEIDNTGWELQGTLRHAALSVHGTLSLVDSRVARTASNYEGELRPGDRMLNVPARVAGLTASWNAPSWSALLTASRAADWIGYDRVPGFDDVPPRGSALRDFWREYDQITLLGAFAHRTLRPGFDLTISAQNLLNARLETADPWLAPAGRIVMVGFRFSF